jgi:hypothetical protein
MLNILSEFILKLANWRAFGYALLLYLAFGAYIMPQAAKKLDEMNGRHVEILDLQFHYTPERARTIIGEYTRESRLLAANFELVGDGVYPFVYTFLFLIINALIVKALLAYGVKHRYIHLFPFFIMVIDYCENTGIITMLRNFPDFPDTIASITSVFTSLKWVAVTIEILFILLGSLLLLYYRLTGKK